MANEKASLETAAGALDGTEVVRVSKEVSPGIFESRQTDTQAIADLVGGGGPNLLDILLIRSPDGGNDLDLVGIDQGGILITTEQTTPGETPGAIIIRTADAVGSAASNIQIEAGDSDTANAGSVTVSGGSNGGKAGAQLTLFPGTTTAAGNIALSAGNSDDVGGDVKLIPGAGGTSDGEVKVGDLPIFDADANPLFVGSSHIRVVAAQFDVTNSTTLVDVTGLAVNVDALHTYTFRATLYTVSDVGTGVKVAIGGTCTETSIIYEASTQNAGAITQSRTTTKGNAVGGVTAVTAARVDIFGTIVVNAAGTLTVQFAENAAVAATTSSVLPLSNFTVTKAALPD